MRKKILGKIYTSPIRSLFRRWGINYLLTAPKRMRAARYRREYERFKPKQVQIEVDGIKIRLLVGDIDEYVRILSFEEDFKIIKTILDSLKRGDCFWDVGASIGVYTTLVAQKVGREGQVIAFEPEPRSFSRLRENLELNDAVNTLPLMLALSNENKKMKLSIARNPSAGSHSLIAKGEHSRESAEIDVFRGDELQVEKKVCLPAAIKIDVEGAEEMVIKGLTQTLSLPQCHTLVCEIHFSLLELSNQENAPLNIIEYLKQSGFIKFKWIDSSHLLAKK